MKKAWFALLCCMAASTHLSQAQEITPAHQPNATQKALQKRGYGMFIHFGINTFAQQEWSDGSYPATLYNPTDLDCDQWVRVARDAGFRYVLLITKHHDGFCLWNSAYTTYDVASSGNPTDVVAEVSKACRKYGLQFAIYYSLWDRKEPSFTHKDPNKYIDFMCNQLTELLTRYGDVCELWLDGGWARSVKDWDLPRVYKLVKKLQPLCAVGVNHTIEISPGSRKTVLPDFMTENDKYGFQYFPTDFRLWDPKIASPNDAKQYVHDGQSYYMPFEHTVCLSKAWNWFQKREPQPVRDLDELEELFYWCTANGNTLVMNIPPDETGRIREYEANAAIELKNRLGLKKGKPLPKNGTCISINRPVEASSELKGNDPKTADKAVDGGMQTCWAAAENDTLPTLTVSLDANRPFNKIAIFECCDVKDGGDGFSNYRTNRIQAYRIEMLREGKWIPIYVSNEVMGDCKIIRFPHSYQTSAIRLKVTAATAPPSIYEFNVIYKE